MILRNDLLSALLQMVAKKTDGRRGEPAYRKLIRRAADAKADIFGWAGIHFRSGHTARMRWVFYPPPAVFCFLRSPHTRHSRHPWHLPSNRRSASPPGRHIPIPLPSETETRHSAAGIISRRIRPRKPGHHQHGNGLSVIFHSRRNRAHHSLIQFTRHLGLHYIERVRDGQTGLVPAECRCGRCLLLFCTAGTNKPSSIPVRRTRPEAHRPADTKPRSRRSQRGGWFRDRQDPPKTIHGHFAGLTPSAVSLFPSTAKSGETC